MSQENVELVVRLQPSPDQDIAQIARDDNLSAAYVEAASPFLHADFESAFPGLLGGGQTYTGFDGLRAGWLKWVEPWATYRAEIKEAIDCGDRVLLLVHDFGRREGSAEEVRGNNAAIWTVREGKIARAEFYTERADALKAVGLGA